MEKSFVNELGIKTTKWAFIEKAEDVTQNSNLLPGILKTNTLGYDGHGQYVLNSIDDIKERFEYQRHPAKWDLVNENILKFKNAGLRNLSTQVCTTINLFNIAYLDELAPYVNEWDPDFWHINSLHHPEEFDIQQLPIHVKDEITEKLLKAKTRKNEITTALNYLNSEPTAQLEKYHDAIKLKIKEIDRRRNENFAVVFPFLNKELKIYD